MKWPPRSLNLTPCNFFLWGYVKDEVFVPLLPLDIYEFMLRITAANRNEYQKQKNNNVSGE
jgi:hypothetical protein